MFRILFLRSFVDRVGDLFSANLNQYKERIAQGQALAFKGDMVELSAKELGHQAASFALSKADFPPASLR